MSIDKNLAAAVFLVLVAAIPLAVAPAHARGGAANLLNSPGYERALAESRKRYQQEAQPSAQPSSESPRKTASRKALRKRGH